MLRTKNEKLCNHMKWLRKDQRGHVESYRSMKLLKDFTATRNVKLKKAVGTCELFALCTNKKARLIIYLRFFICFAFRSAACNWLRQLHEPETASHVPCSSWGFRNWPWCWVSEAEMMEREGDISLFEIFIRQMRGSKLFIVRRSGMLERSCFKLSSSGCGEHGK